MTIQEIMEVFENTAYVRMGGSQEELRCAQYLVQWLERRGMEAQIAPFPVAMAQMEEEVLLVDGEQIPCKGYLCAGSGQVEGDLYYLRSRDPYALSQCRGKIVLVDGYLGYWLYQDLLENGAIGFITYDGHINYADRDIDQRELRGYVSQGRKIPGVNINAKDAVALVSRGARKAKITLRQREYEGQSHNVILDLPGEREEFIVFTAHYDSTSLSQGAYDNMSGAVGLLALAEHFSQNSHRYGLRFLWCGSEERGLLGSKAYCQEEQRLQNCVLCINLDMIGCIMGHFIACVTGEEKLCHYLSYLGQELGFPVKTSQDVYSSDSTPFADKGVPAVSFARTAPGSVGTIHNRYDTKELIGGEQMEADIAFLTAFATRMAQAACCPVAREMPDSMKEKLDIYLCRKREKK